MLLEWLLYSLLSRHSENLVLVRMCFSRTPGQKHRLCVLTSALPVSDDMTFEHIP